MVNFEGIDLHHCRVDGAYAVQLWVDVRTGSMRLLQGDFVCSAG
jgi:hypothetical protein